MFSQFFGGRAEACRADVHTAEPKTMGVASVVVNPVAFRLVGGLPCAGDWAPADELGWYIRLAHSVSFFMAPQRSSLGAHARTRNTRRMWFRGSTVRDGT